MTARPRFKVGRMDCASVLPVSLHPCPPEGIGVASPGTTREGYQLASEDPPRNEALLLILPHKHEHV